VSIAGNQVFAGAHGNGELVALTLDSGRLGFRLRAPNWIHHEPAIVGNLFVVGFGNNERYLMRQRTHDGKNGSDPSGIAAYDRLTGREVWRHYTATSVMTTPVVRDSTVAAITGGGEAIGLRLADGKLIWRTTFRGESPMNNPVLLDSLMIFGVEDVNACAVNVVSGRLAYCVSLMKCDSALAVTAADSVTDGRCWGAGHASPAVAGDLVLQVMELDFNRKRGADPVSRIVKKIIGIPFKHKPPEVGEQVLVAYRWRDGKVRWRTPLGRGNLFPAGHIAGTPTIIGDVAYVPSANNGHVVAVDVNDGRILWSTAVNAARGSVLASGQTVLAATRDTTLVVLDRAKGTVACRQKLPGLPDRASITVSGQTGILTFRNGLIMARPLRAWMACQA
jgi:outer membrane protein assembly factor BamB